jgi:O-methyltransferase
MAAGVGARARKERSFDAAFLALADSVTTEQRTLLNRKRLWVLWQAVRNAAPLEGAAAEVGAYRGGSAFFIASAFGREVTFEVIDTFAGHPPDALSDLDHEAHRQPKFRDTTFEDVVAYLSPFPRLTVHQGDFATISATLPERAYSLVHVDVDIYAPAVQCLEYFGPRLKPGGIIVLDDYDAPKCPGIRRAVEDFLGPGDPFQTWRANTEQLILVKR